MIAFHLVTKVYHTKRETIRSLDGVELRIERGAFVVIRGPSGCGKTTLLLTAGGMLRPDQGRVTVGEQALYDLSGRERAQLRATMIGFVFQMFHLVPYLSAIDNVRLAAGPQAGDAGGRRAAELLGQMGLARRSNHRPAELSAGERQRTAIARALYHRPALILADEPTGNLDPDNARQVFEQLAAFHQGGGTVVVVTHGTAADAYATQVLTMKNGRIHAD